MTSGDCIVSISCIVLAGGKGSRLGRDKASVKICNRSLLEQVVSCLNAFNGEIIIVTATDKELPQFTFRPELRTIMDIYPGRGPLSGIHSGLMASRSYYNLVVACDMPFINEALMSYMIQVSTGFDIVVPRLNNMLEPLHAVYSKGCLGPIQRLLMEGRLSVLQLLTLTRVRYIETEEINRFDPEHLSFLNINTENDLERARRLAAIGEATSSGRGPW
jgi:molybdopterin-guanine dinucleotide biosynthesis protein A